MITETFIRLEQISDIAPWPTVPKLVEISPSSKVSYWKNYLVSFFLFYFFYFIILARIKETIDIAVFVYLITSDRNILFKQKVLTLTK